MKRAIIIGLSAATFACLTAGWGAFACTDQPAAPIEAVDASNGGTHAKRNLTTQMLWVWGDSIVCPGGCFDMGDQRSFISWGYNKSNHSIPWIDKSGRGRCLTPYGSCSVIYGEWRTEVCDRNGNDTCLFRREAQHHFSFTYGIAFNAYKTSCVGTRINWDGSHVRNAWGGDCAGGSAATAANQVQTAKLTVGSGGAEVPLSRYLDKRQIRQLQGSCFGPNSVDRCMEAAASIYRSLTPELKRALRPTACAALSPDSLRKLAPGSKCERRANDRRN